MLIYAILWLILFMVTAVFNVLPNPLSVLTISCPAFLYVVPVAVYVHFREWGRTIGLIVGALMAVLLGSAVLLMVMKLVGGYTPRLQLSSTQFAGMVGMSAANALLISSMGLPIGLGTSRGWTYGRVVVATIATFSVLVGVYLKVCWASFNRIIDSMIAWFTEQLNLQAAEMGQELVDEQIAGLRWFGENKFALAVGIEFAVYLMLTCVLVSITVAILRRWFADPGTIGSFRDMRPPDWLVWGGIATAVLWYVEHQYGGGIELRFVTWNVAVGLSSIYFLNGCAVFIYGLSVLAPGLFLLVLLVFMFVMSGLYPALSMIGLFDTWANFRVRMDRLAQAIRDAQSGES
ncbi:MAG: DUF2232 domain-containing protein [Candidatus Hydrogenedentes bacterium]|nr:DUF2232 domain-containing protein [Candidatus Hydrogenedentota bacterium]